MWRRVALAAAVIVLSTAGATATAALLEVKSFTDALRLSPRLRLGSLLTPARAGRPQTVLVIGSDKRAPGAGLDAESPPHSDTMLLVRLDPARGASMLSVPRDLKVAIDPPGGRLSVQKINAAYAIGGARLAAQTVERVLGLRINHVVDVSFAGFKAGVDAVGCVYIDVDHRYFNDNSDSGGDPYATIDLQPGYQRLCGQAALDYVRFRHTDTDLVRNARQQDFLREAAAQIGATGLIDNRRDLERILGRFTETDIRSAHDVVQLLELALADAGRPLRQVRFRAHVGPSFVTADAVQIRTSVDELLDPRPPAAPVAPPRAPTTGSGKRALAPAPIPLETVNPDDLAPAHRAAGRLPFPLLYPVRRDVLSASPDNVRVYRLPDEQGHEHAAYHVTISRGVMGQYYGVEGTDWLDPPILRHPDEMRRRRGRTFELFRDGQRLRLVAWRTPRAVYWLDNTLQHTLSARAMMRIALAVQPVGRS